MADLTQILRPESLEGFVGQEHLVGPKGTLSTLLQKHNLPHAFFFGPPGTGKTTLARIVAKALELPFFEFNATGLKVEELRKVFAQYRGGLLRPLVFIDEVHRLAKNQQEILLPVMEKNEALIIGASTENPFFVLTAAIRSRGMLFEFKPLEIKHLERILQKAALREPFSLDEDAKHYLIYSSGGDARAMLKLLEFALLLAEDGQVGRELLERIRPGALTDGASSDETHYNLASALIKSIRGSDPDAAIYYLARLIKGGEEPRFIARRLVILASEDIGNANPNALNLAVSTFRAVADIGYPECRIILSQLVLYLAHSPKSNSAIMAIDKAMAAVEAGTILDVPDFLKDGHYAGAKSLGRAVGYRYPHDFGGWVEQQYTAKPVHFVELSDIGFEQTLKEWRARLIKEGGKKG